MQVVLRIRWDLAWRDAAGADRFPERCTLEWQLERWRLFTRYTLPSLRAQTHGRVAAWLFADAANEALHRQLPGVADLAPATFVYNWKAVLPSVLTGEPILYARIDSDDALAPDALERMVGATQELGDKRYVQLATGVAWHESAGELFRWVNPSPPFLGSVVPADELRERGLPPFGNHTEAHAQSKPLETERPTFCVVLHGGNVSNSRDGAWCRDLIEGDERAALGKLFGL